MQGKNLHTQKAALEYLFHPRSIAIAGVSDDLTKTNAGRILLKPLLSSGYKGKIYPINPSGSEVFGLKIYPSIKDVPGPVDHIISAIPAQYTPQLIADCAAKGVKTVHLFTAGFSEIGSEEGKQLELQVAAIARDGGIRLIGPNCMGLYCPKTGLSFCTEFPKESGSVGYIAQSGGNSLFGVLEAAMRGIGFSKVISYGNGCDLNETDFLEYLIHDSETKVIAAYIEGVKDGTRFMEVLKQAVKVKPVIIFKAGTTETGAQVASSHTGSIAGSDRIWSSLLRQVGVIQVYSIEELVDIILLFTYMSPPKGRNTAVIGVGGGASVQAADDCLDARLRVPMLPAETRQRLKDIFATEAGRIFRNPLDIFPYGQPLTQKAIEIIANCDQIDLLIIHVQIDVNPVPETELLSGYTESIISLGKEVKKRTAVVLHSIASAKSKQAASEAQTALYKAGLPVYPSISRAANAISKFIHYHRNLSFYQTPSSTALS